LIFASPIGTAKENAPSSPLRGTKKLVQFS
jgi:hypothetical protein